VVKALTNAAYENRTYDTITFSGAIAAGAVHAIEAGFSGKQPKILRHYQESLLKQLRKVKGTNLKRDAAALLSGFGGFAPKETVKRGRRKHNP
jgi:hypothetical protein